MPGDTNDSGRNKPVAEEGNLFDAVMDEIFGEEKEVPPAEQTTSQAQELSIFGEIYEGIGEALAVAGDALEHMLSIENWGGGAEESAPPTEQPEVKAGEVTSEEAKATPNLEIVDEKAKTTEASPGEKSEAKASATGPARSPAVEAKLKAAIIAPTPDLVDDLFEIRDEAASAAPKEGPNLNELGKIADGQAGETKPPAPVEASREVILSEAEAARRGAALIEEMKKTAEFKELPPEEQRIAIESIKNNAGKFVGSDVLKERARVDHSADIAENVGLTVGGLALAAYFLYQFSQSNNESGIKQVPKVRTSGK